MPLADCGSGSDVGVAGGRDFAGGGGGDELLDATAGSGVDVDELDGHAVAGLDAADHASDDKWFGGAEGEAKLDSLTTLKGTGIEKIEAVDG